MPPKRELLPPGVRFGSLVVVSDNRKKVLCMCDCGNLTEPYLYNMRAGKTTSCGCAHKKMVSDLGKRLSKYANPFGAPIGDAFRRTLRQARRRNLEFEMTEEEYAFTVSSDCSYCGAPPGPRGHWRNGKPEYFANGVDRVDNTKGYIHGNTVSCCAWCNGAKSAHKMEHFIDKCSMVANNKKHNRSNWFNDAQDMSYIGGA